MACELKLFLGQNLALLGSGSKLSFGFWVQINEIGSRFWVQKGVIGLRFWVQIREIGLRMQPVRGRPALLLLERESTTKQCTNNSRITPETKFKKIEILCCSSH